MSDDRQALKDTFAAHAAKDPEAIRDRDNANPRIRPPVQVQRPAPNLAPPGAIGIQRGLPAAPLPNTEKAPVYSSVSDSFNDRAAPDSHPGSINERLQRAGIDITSDNPDIDLWISGRFRDQPHYAFTAKIYDLPSEHGIDGGRISKLTVYRDGDIAARYDRSWVQQPESMADRKVIDCLKGVVDDRMPTRERPDRSIERDR